MPIEVTCQCGSAYRLDDSRAGELFHCKICAASIPLPGERSPAPTGAVAESAGAAAPPPVPEAVVAATASSRPAEGPPLGRSLDGDNRRGDSWARIGESLSPQPAAHTPSRPAPPGPAVAPPVAETPVKAPVQPNVRSACDNRRPGRAWWTVRGVLLALAAGMFFLPWFTASATFEAVTRSESASGFDFLRGCLEGFGLNGAASGSGRGSLPSLGELPGGAGRAGAGLMMMGLAPVVYALGLLSAVLFGWRAWRRGGRGAKWPFAICLGAMSLFLPGWLLFSGYGPVKQALLLAAQLNVSIGPSGWAYLVWFLLLPMTFIAAGRPDFVLQAAARMGAEPDPDEMD